MRELLNDIWIIIETYYTQIKPQLENAITGVLGQYLNIVDTIKRLWILIPIIAGIIVKIYKKINCI